MYLNRRLQKHPKHAPLPEAAFKFLPHTEEKDARDERQREELELGEVNFQMNEDNSD